MKPGKSVDFIGSATLPIENYARLFGSPAVFGARDGAAMPTGHCRLALRSPRICRSFALGKLERYWPAPVALL
jgi:hypothetical protein